MSNLTEAMNRLKESKKLTDEQINKVKEKVDEMVEIMRKDYSDDDILEIIDDEGILSNDSLYGIDGIDMFDDEIESEVAKTAYNYLRTVLKTEITRNPLTDEEITESKEMNNILKDYRDVDIAAAFHMLVRDNKIDDSVTELVINKMEELGFKPQPEE